MCLSTIIKLIYKHNANTLIKALFVSIRLLLNDSVSKSFN